MKASVRLGNENQVEVFRVTPWFRACLRNSAGLAKRACLMLAVVPALAVPLASAQQTPPVLNDDGYKVKPIEESEFDNDSDYFVKGWQQSVPRQDYEDTEFGALMYNEASTPTRLEVLRLLSKDTPSILVFLTAVSMGLDVETVLQAAARYQPNKGRDLAASAVEILPLIPDAPQYVYNTYELDDLERDDETQPYSVAEVMERFFDDRRVLGPAPDWIEGQYHFLASAAELVRLREPKKNISWYKSRSTQDVSSRPIFISLYEENGSVLIDSQQRIERALAADKNAMVPVVFIFNRVNERSADELGEEYPATIQGVQRAYMERGLMLTPAPEWETGEYHIAADIDEFYDVFDIPEEQDFEPEAWQTLLAEAENYSVTDTSLIAVIIGSGDGEGEGSSSGLLNETSQYATWDDPRSEEAFPYVDPSDGSPMTLKAIVGKGIILNRPDLVAALNALGVEELPIVFYYIDNNRVKPFLKRPQVLIDSITGNARIPGRFNGGGGISPPPLCASPPCTERP
ncbi:hypothetical protein [Arenicella xantha]|nr:hypothetical protein [Arenicella xantha]